MTKQTYKLNENKFREFISNLSPDEQLIAFNLIADVITYSIITQKIS